MKKLLTLLFLLGASNAFAQFTAPSIQWQKSFGGSRDENASCIRQTFDKGFIVAGSTSSMDGDLIGRTNIYHDCWVVKMDSTGNTQWRKVLGGTGDDLANSIVQTRDGGYVLAGYSNSNDGDLTDNYGLYDYWIIKLNSTGAVEWQKSLGGTNYDYANAIQQTIDGGYIIAGSSQSNYRNDIISNYGFSDYWIIKLDSAGVLLWEKNYGGSSWDFAYSIEQTNDGGYVVAGGSSSTDIDVTGNHNETDFWIVKLNDTGAIQWQQSLGGNEKDVAKSIEQTKDGGYIVAGVSTSTDGDLASNYGYNDWWISKLSSTGSIQWKKSLGSSLDDNATSIRQTVDSGYIIAGNAGFIDGDVMGGYTRGDYWVIKLDKAGAMQWQKSLGGTEDDYAFSIEVTTDGGYIVAGSARSADGDVTDNHGDFDFWVVKIGPDPTAVSSIETDNSFSLFPNPTTTELRIQANEAIRSVLITDISGKEVLRAGNTTVIPTTTLANGLYLVRITTDKGINTQKLSVQH